MTAPRLATLGLALGLAATTLSPAAAQTRAASPSPRPAPASAPQPPAPPVDPAAVKALSDMSAFLQSLSSFELTSRTSLDLVANDDQKIQLDGVATYRVRKPDAFVIDVVSDDWNRRYIYDGRQFTLYAPTLGYFSSWDAPPTIKDTVSDLSNRFGISLPLDDLFRWSEPGGTRPGDLRSGYLVGVETLDGVKTRHYAFREDHIDWQVWIQQDGQPLPRKVVIVDRRDPAHPAYIARLSWVLNPRLTDADFAAAQPPKDARRIRITVQQQMAGGAP